jgi:hypothetical protein
MLHLSVVKSARREPFLLFLEFAVQEIRLDDLIEEGSEGKMGAAFHSGMDLRLNG